MSLRDRCLAYKRPERRVYGIRNHVLILPTTSCVNRVVERIAEEFKDVRWGEYEENRVVPVLHNSGCCHVGFDQEIVFDALLGTASHPNVYAVLLVSLGCGQMCKGVLRRGEDPTENLEKFRLYDRLLKRSVKVYWVNVQERHHPLARKEDGELTGEERAVRIGIRVVEKLVDEARRMKRVECSLDRIVIGVGNGASDPTSGLFANPGVGHVVDEFISRGGTVVFGQAIEVIGAEDYLFERAKRDYVRYKLKRLIETTVVLKEGVQEYLGIADPTPGNIRSGISTLAEKSIGTILKIGHNKKIELKDVLRYAKKIPRNGGLYFMDTPGHDICCITGMVAGGAHAVIFTTGLGTPTGSPVAPVIKVTANRETYENLRDFIDVYIPVEEIFSDGKSLRQVTLEHIWPYLIDVLSGRPCKAEKLGHHDFEIRNMWFKI